MHYHSLKYEIKDHVMVIRIISPATGPLKIDSLADELTDLCEEMESNGRTWVVVLAGIGENPFSLEGIEPETTQRSIAGPIAKLDLPVIAAIHGDAVGQGLELALACDVRISTEDSRFGLPQIQKGLIPWDGGTQRLSRVIGKSKALELILTGEIIDAQEAYRIGLANRLVSPGDLEAVVGKMAQEIASKAPIALKYAKETIYKGMDLTLEQGLHLEADLYLLLHTTKDRTEGIKAFREKRTPRFEGN